MADSLFLKGVMTGHTDMVTAIAAPVDNSDMIVSSSRDKSILVWHLTKDTSSVLDGSDAPAYGVPRRRLTGHSHFIEDVVLSSDGQFALSGSWDGDLRLWDLNTGITTRRFVGHTKDVLSVAFSNDNRQIVSASRDRTIKLWNTLGECKYTIQDGDSHTNWVSCVKFSPNTLVQFYLGFCVIRDSAEGQPPPPAFDIRSGKPETMTEPSKVIHVRNVGLEISENDLLQLVQPFGMVSKLVMLRAKNQTLLQMQDLSSAMNLIQYYQGVQPSIRGRNVYMQFSSHQELTTDQNNQARRDQDSEPNRILLVTIHHMLYPITVEVLHQVFSPHGFVEKIVTFQKSAGFQALIQYQTRQSAILARTALQERNIYDGCCQLDIQFSNLTELQVNYNNERSRDYTNPSLPTEQKGRSSQPVYGDPSGLFGLQPAGARAVGYHQLGNPAAIAAAFGGGLPPGISGTNDRCTILVSNLNPDKVDEDKLFNLFSLYGNIVRVKMLRNKPDHALVQMEDGFQAEMAVHFLKGSMLFGKNLEVNFSKHPNITASPDARDYAGSNLNRFNRNTAKNYRYCCSPTKMIHISTLPQDVTENEITSHVEEHGTIVGSKVFEVNGKKQALVLFENEEEATEALVCKHATTIDRSLIRISFSQLQNI